MKFQSIITFSLLFASTDIDAFSPSVKRAQPSNAPSMAVAVEMGIDKPLYDPLGLYPNTSPERKAGLIQPLESYTGIDTQAPLMDPLGLYGDSPKVVDSLDASASLPFLERPKYLDGSLAGDRGFDPFNFASSPEALLKYRNSELKHARLAMLAAVGWPLAELFHGNLASSWNLPSALNLNDRVPSILNGGLGNISPVFWVAALAAAGTIEAFSGKVNEIQSPDLGFDPLGLGKGKQRSFMEESELFNGRLAMLAITGFAIQEFVTGNSVVDAIPIFFKPLNIAVEQLLHAGVASA